MKLFNFSLIFFFFNLTAFDLSYSFSEKSCVIKDILSKPNNPNCSDNDSIYGYLSFDSELINHKYIFNKVYNVDILEDYLSEIRNFLINYCKVNNKTQIKYIINLNKTGIKRYNNRVIISCKYKSL